MSTGTLGSFPSLEWGSYEDELQPFGEFEHEGEYEDQEFWSSLASIARSAAQNPTLRRIGLTAARKAISAMPDLGGSLGAPGSVWSDVGRAAGRGLSRDLRRRLPAREFEWESDGEYEVNPIAKAYPDAVMEHLGRAATEAQDEAQAESFVGALVPLALAQARRSVPGIMAATPQVVQAAANVTRGLRSSPSTRPLVRTVPGIVGQTALNLARQAGAGRPVTPEVAVRALANQTARTLTDAQRCMRAYRRSQALDQRYHRSLVR